MQQNMFAILILHISMLKNKHKVLWRVIGTSADLDDSYGDVNVSLVSEIVVKAYYSKEKSLHRCGTEKVRRSQKSFQSILRVTQMSAPVVFLIYFDF